VAPFVLREVTVDLEGTRILDPLDLTIEKGEYVVLLGENGSGKTTLLRALLGLAPTASGTVHVHGTPLDRFRDWRRIAYVPQQLLAATTVPVSVDEVVGAARISPATRWRRGRSASPTLVRESLEAVGLAHRRRDRFDSLSGGQQRRVMVARALATGADTLLLDEPTAGVDADSELRMADVLSDLHSEGRTIVLVTHDLGEIAAPATRAIVVGGRGPRRVLYDGTPPPPLEIYAHVWHHDADRTAHP
jgi:zinc transport system ATP-binding protein